MVECWTLICSKFNRENAHHLLIDWWIIVFLSLKWPRQVLSAWKWHLGKWARSEQWVPRKMLWKKKTEKMTFWVVSLGGQSLIWLPSMSLSSGPEGFDSQELRTFTGGSMDSPPMMGICEKMFKSCKILGLTRELRKVTKIDWHRYAEKNNYHLLLNCYLVVPHGFSISMFV